MKRPQFGGTKLGPSRGNGAVAARDVRPPADHIRFAAAVQFCSDQAAKTGYDFWDPRSEAIFDAREDCRPRGSNMKASLARRISLLEQRQGDSPRRVGLRTGQQLQSPDAD